ncbi:hydrogenase maturation protease [Glycomyces harbinensis]|uniref:Hydrogenase maturation protease n=1 Tax=Glycomyces harbinensis TaxID=58114 RepID=A0A1G6XMI2_9ACTN|nr:hydrogenase maturation protease [Glycomyces harbinensis]SDD79439.1 hydrogenase maturation protease [Glycomyces harbinensis]
MRPVVIIGVGNVYRRDDGVGVAVVQRLRETGLPDWVTSAVSDGEPAQLVELWSRTELAIVVDALAVRAAIPGAVHRIEIDAVEGVHAPSASSHGLGLGTAARLARELGRLPERLIVYAVEISEYAFGDRMSPAVASAAEHIAEHVEADLADFEAALRSLPPVATGER